MPRQYKTLVFRPLQGFLDTRSNPDEMAQGSVRWRQNFQILDERRVCRRAGFEKRLSGEAYNNQDLHDQLVNLQTYYDDLDPKPDGADTVSEYPSALCGATLKSRTQGREPITMLEEVVATSGRRLLFAGTSSRIQLYSPFTKSWQMVTDGMGTGRSRFYAAQVRNTITFTNGYDRPFYHQISQSVQGCARRRINHIPDLATIGLTTASFCTSWKGITLLMDVTMDGLRRTNRIVWSDFNKPFSYVPKAGSVAGFQDLDPGEIILNALPLGDHMIIYTDRGIWQMAVSGNSEQPLLFFKAYSEPNGRDKCLAFRNAVASIGSAHLFMAQDGIYLYTTSLPEPEQVQWIHRSTDTIYEDINLDYCDLVVMGFWPEMNEIYVSWPQAGEETNTRTMAFNIKQIHQFADIIDHGFTAFSNQRPETRQTLGDFLMEYGICSASELASDLVKEGGIPSITEKICEPSYVWNSSEDFDEPEGAESLCNCFDGLRIADICGPCDSDQIFIAASAEDFSIKQMGGAFSREICDNPELLGSTTSNGYQSPSGTTYTTRGYKSIVRMGPLDVGKPEDMKNVRRLLIEGYPADTASPAWLHLRFGTSYSAFDANTPLTERCAPLWKSQDPQEFDCAVMDTGQELLDANQVQGLGFQWELYEDGYHLYIELTIADEDGDDVTGGEGCLSRFEMDTRIKESGVI